MLQSNTFATTAQRLPLKIKRNQMFLINRKLILQKIQWNVENKYVYI